MSNSQAILDGKLVKVINENKWTKPWFIHCAFKNTQTQLDMIDSESLFTTLKIFPPKQ